MAKKEQLTDYYKAYTDEEVLHQLINNAENRAQMEYLKRKNHLDDAGVQRKREVELENQRLRGDIEKLTTELAKKKSEVVIVQNLATEHIKVTIESLAEQVRKQSQITAEARYDRDY